jgi:hypothetical protein
MSHELSSGEGDEAMAEEQPALIARAAWESTYVAGFVIAAGPSFGGDISRRESAMRARAIT